jgi:hypothetical protein
MINRKKFKELLPKDRPYVPLEAIFHLQLNADEKNPGSISGYAKSWGWSRTKVRSFLKKWHPIEQPLEQSKEQPAKQAKGHTLATNTSQSGKNENMSKNMSKNTSKDIEENRIFPIKCELKKHGIKLWQLSNKVGIHETRLSGIIRHRIKPNHGEREKISRALEVPENILFGKP